jgi:hypothetical protein
MSYTESPAWDALRQYVRNRLRTAMTEEADRLIRAAENYGRRCPLHSILGEIKRQQDEEERRRIFNLRNGVFSHEGPRRSNAFTKINRRRTFHN